MFYGGRLKKKKKTTQKPASFTEPLTPMLLFEELSRNTVHVLNDRLVLVLDNVSRAHYSICISSLLQHPTRLRALQLIKYRSQTSRWDKSTYVKSNKC